MKKIFLSIILVCLLLIIFIPFLARAQGPIVTCGNAADGSDACTINDFFQMLVNIYNFIILYLATPLAVIAIIVGGIMMMVSAGNPNLMGMGKKIVYTAIIGITLAFCSWLIIDFILHAIGYTGDWSNVGS